MKNALGRAVLLFLVTFKDVGGGVHVSHTVLRRSHEVRDGHCKWVWKRELCECLSDSMNRLRMAEKPSSA